MLKTRNSINSVLVTNVVALTFDIINWFNSPSEKRQYPKSRLKNKNLFRKKMKKYDYVDGTLFKYMKGSDGIGKV